MNSKPVVFILLCFWVSGAIAKPGDHEREQSKLSRIVDQTFEESLYTKIKLNHGHIFINKAPDAKIFTGEFLFSDRPPVVAYEIVGNQGRLTVKFSQNHYKNKNENFDCDPSIEINWGDRYNNECYLNFSDQVALSLKMDCGFVKGDIELGGLKIEECYINAAFSEANIYFEKPNKMVMEELHIENGFGDLKVYNLCNANFSVFGFDAGVGSYVLDFGGELRQNAQVNIDIGVGKLVLYLPRSFGISIAVDKSFLSSFEIDDVYKKDNRYYNENWNTNIPSLDIELESGIAQVRVEWID